MSTHHQLVFCTCPNPESARSLAHKLVANHLAACVNVIPGLVSIYPWQGEIETDNEVLLLIKTHGDRYRELENFIRANHPYELPEVIAVSIEQGSKNYLNWINEWLESSA